MTLPVTLAVVTAVTQAPAWWKGVAAVLGASGVAVLGAALVRWLGQRRQPRLWESWDEPPTTRLLRHRNAPNPELVARRHALIAKVLQGEPLPTAEQEADEPQAADQRYEVAVSALREQTRDPEKFPRVAAENAEYGFRRNRYACRPLGAALAVLVAAASGAAVAAGGGHGSWTRLALAFLLAADLLLLAAYSLVRPAFVRAAAESYAERLLGSLETLAQP